jgi:signal transduction histidine kinase
VSSEGERLTALINELLDLAKIESGKVDWKMVELQPAALIERAVNATSALFEQKPSLKLITEVPDDLPSYHWRQGSPAAGADQPHFQCGEVYG